MKRIVVLVMVALVLAGVHAQEEVPITLSLKDTEGKAVSNMFVEVSIKNAQTNEGRKIARYQEENTVELTLVPGSYIFEFRIDDFETDGKDLYGMWESTIKTGNVVQEIIVFPVGTIRGTVFDKLNNLVRNVNLKLDCAKEYGEALPSKTDKYGYFSADYVPTGTCKVIASTSDARGIEDVIVKKGEVTEVVVNLDASGEQEKRILIGIGVLVVLTGGVLVVWRRKLVKKQLFGRKEHKEEKQEVLKEEGKEEKQKLHKRTEDILKTLNSKERQVVEFLLESAGKSTQAKIRFGTGIPKTSLARVLESLRAKKVITIEQILKMKKVELTPWFLGKEGE